MTTIHLQSSFHLPKLELRAHETLTPQAPVTSALLSGSRNLTTLGTLYEWNHNYLSFATGLFHLARCLQGSSMMAHVSENPHF